MKIFDLRASLAARAVKAPTAVRRSRSQPTIIHVHQAPSNNAVITTTTVESRPVASVAAPDTHSFLAGVKKKSRAGKVPTDADDIAALLKEPPRTLKVFLTDPKEADYHRRRDEFLYEFLGLGPHCTNLKSLKQYVAFLGSRPSTFSTYCSHIRSLSQLENGISSEGISDYQLIRLFLDDPLGHSNTDRMETAVKFFRDCLGLNGLEAFNRQFKNGLAFLNPAGCPRIRGSLGREKILEIVSHAEFTGSSHNEFLRNGLIWQGAFGFRSGRMATLRLSNFHLYEVEGQTTLRFRGPRQKKKGYSADGNSAEIQTALPAWWPHLKDYYEARKSKTTNPNDMVEDPYMFPRWDPNEANAKIKVAVAALGYNPNIVWVSHCARKGAANDAAEKAINNFGWDSPGSLEMITQAIMDVTGHLSETMAQTYAVSQPKRDDLAEVRHEQVKSRRVIMNTSSPFFSVPDRHRFGGRIHLANADDVRWLSCPK